MASPTPPPPNEVPETASTYERDTVDPTLKRENAKPGSSPQGPNRTGALDDAQSRASTPMQTSGQGAKTTSDAAHPSPLPAGGELKGSMKSEEPLGWDQAPTDIKDPRQQRHPRPDGVGGSEPDSAKRDPHR